MSRLEIFVAIGCGVWAFFLRLYLLGEFDGRMAWEGEASSRSDLRGGGGGCVPRDWRGGGGSDRGCGRQ